MRLSLQELGKQKKWVEYEPYRSMSSKSDCVTIGFYPKKNPSIAEQVKIQIGSQILAKLDWQMKDKLRILHHPDDLLSFMLIKSDTNKGWCLSRDGSGNIARVQFKWDRPLVVKPCKQYEVEFITTLSGALIFRAEE